MFEKSIHEGTSNEIDEILQAFANFHFCSKESVSNMSELELGLLAVWCSCLEYLNVNISVKFSSNNVLDNLVSGLLLILGENKQNSKRLSLAVSCLGFVIKGHNCIGEICTENNTIQLLKLLMNKIVYPSIGIDTEYSLKNVWSLLSSAQLAYFCLSSYNSIIFSLEN